MKAEEKAKEISALLDQPEIDLWKLRALAISEGGLVNGKEASCASLSATPAPTV